MKRLVLAIALIALLPVSSFLSERAFSQTESTQKGDFPAGMVPHLVKRVPPVYPEAALQQRISGNVVLQATIDRDGNVASVVGKGNPILLQAAIEAVKQWKYAWTPGKYALPSSLNGPPVRLLEVSSKSPCEVDASSLPCVASRAHHDQSGAVTAPPAFARPDPSIVEITLIFSQPPQKR